MKKLKRQGLKFLILSLFILGMISGIGCTPKKQDEVAAPPATDTPVSPTTAADPQGSGTDTSVTSADGDSVVFTPVNITTFNSYVGTHPINSPKNIRLSVNLSDAGGFRYAGTIKISYEDNGQTFEGVFSSGSSNNYSFDGGLDNNTLESYYNYWFRQNSKLVFSGFFQDQFGAIVLVIDSSLDQGDAQGSSYVGGSVYFRNFAQSKATQSPYRKCWFIYDGPYDCRSDIVIKKSGLYPSTTENYIKLGTFSGLSKNKAFNL